MGTLFTKKGTFSIPEDQQQVLRGRLETFDFLQSQKNNDLREYRNQLLQQTDWIIVKATETNIGISSDWIDYRQSLRDLPQNERFPDRLLISDWPLSPDQTGIPEEAKIFIAEISDPVGLGTTSWIAQDENGFYYEQPQPPINIIVPDPIEPEPETPVVVDESTDNVEPETPVVVDESTDTEQPAE